MGHIPWKLPIPPGETLPEVPRDYEHYDVLVKQVVAQHWNSAVQLLEKGADGYAAVIRLRDQLSSRLAKEIHQIEQESLPDAIARRVIRVLLYEAESHGSDATVGASITDRPPPSEDEWSWELRRSSHQQRAPIVPGELPALFALRSPDIDRLVSECERIDSHSFVEFERDTTWASGLARMSDIKMWYGPEQSGRDGDVVRLVEFRLQVVEQVITQYELLGHVEPIEVEEEVVQPLVSLGPPDIREYREDHLLFIVLAHEAVANDPERRISRSALLGGKKGAIGGVDARAVELRQARPEDFGQMKWSGGKTGGKAVYLAERPPIEAFRSEGVVGNDRVFFDHRIEELYEEVSAAGIHTVDDVADNIRRREGR